MPRTTEAEIINAICHAVRMRSGKFTTIAELIERLPKYLELTDDDRAPSKTRPGEELWHQQVRNVRSHKSYIGRHLVAKDGGFSMSPFDADPTPQPSKHDRDVAREFMKHIKQATLEDVALLVAEARERERLWLKDGVSAMLHIRALPEKGGRF